jgi:putative copper export protein/mono/diheme cytochrome c family protein
MEVFLIAARFIHFTAVILLTGVFAFECLIAGPALRLARAPPVNLVGLHRRLGWLAWVSLALAIGSGAAWLVAVAAGMSGKPLSVALSQGAEWVVLTRTRFGEDWQLRLALAVVLGLCLLARRWASEAIGWAALLLAAAMLASLAWAGHGASTPGAAGDLHLAADFLHLLAAGLWLGTLPPLILFLAEERRTGGPGWAAVTATATRRYSTMAIAGVTVLLAGGLINTWFLAGTVPALVGTGYGRLLLTKIGLFVAMLMVAAVNLLRLTPRLARGGVPNVVRRTVARLQSNAGIETAFGLGVVAVVSVLGTIPPGLHAEPQWPFPFRLDIDALTVGAKAISALLALIVCGCAIAAVVAIAAGRYRRTAVFAVALLLCLIVGWFPLRPAIEPAYPTSFYVPAEPYAAASVARGAGVYADNCVQCHGATGRGDGPAAAGLPVRPANLIEPHLFAHSPGDLFWWVSHGMDEGIMPGFAEVLSPNQRWDVINFVRARAAGAVSAQVGPEVTAAAAPEVPDFAFEAHGAQRTLHQTLDTGPALLVLFAPPAPMARLRQLTAAQSQLSAAGLHVIAIGLGPAPVAASEEGPPLVVGISSDVVATLALFRTADDGGETELMLDRAGDVRARWTHSAAGGLPPPASLVADAAQVAQIRTSAPEHAGHMHQ